MDKEQMETHAVLDQYLSPQVRHFLEANYYAKINDAARLSNIMRDTNFLAHPLEHFSLSTDHGLIHVRDIAMNLLDLLEQLNGVHFPKRNEQRLKFMQGYGVMLAYLHGLGMLDPQLIQQNLCAEFSASAIYQEKLEKELFQLWESNSGNVAWHISQLCYKKILTQMPHLIFREMLTLCCAYDKKYLAANLFNYPVELRRDMQTKLMHSTFTKNALNLYYQDFAHDSFLWLVDEHKEAIEFAEDVIDTLRVLRCAKASRQRGARLRANGGYQIFLDQQTAQAVYAINAQDKLYLLKSSNTLLGGEVNLSGSEFTREGDLRISFYHGKFADHAATEKAIFNAAVAINDVQEDMLESFVRAKDHNRSTDYLRKWQTIYILLENCDDNPEFNDKVKQQLAIQNPHLHDNVRLVPSLQNASALERERYLSAKELPWNQKEMQDFVEKVALSGHKLENITLEKAFTDVKLVHLETGETLIEVNTPASFVYIPLHDGLTGYPLGGYQPFPSRAFIPLGTTGVIRGDLRNATVVAENALDVIIIPREIYMAHWDTAYSEAEFVGLLNTGKISAA